jgi:hypothetical protein
VVPLVSVSTLISGLQKYAIKPHPGSHCEETPYLGVTLACSRDQEAVRRPVLLSANGKELIGGSGDVPGRRWAHKTCGGFEQGVCGRSCASHSRGCQRLCVSFCSSISFLGQVMISASPARVHAALVDPESGRKYASVNKISGVGHLVRQAHVQNRLHY